MIYNREKYVRGMPYLLSLDTDEKKYNYLAELFEEIYFKDIEERYDIRLPGVLRELTSSLCSSVGSLTNASKISRAMDSVKGIKTDPETISSYLSYNAYHGKHHIQRTDMQGLMDFLTDETSIDR